MYQVCIDGILLRKRLNSCWNTIEWNYTNLFIITIRPGRNQFNYWKSLGRITDCLIRIPRAIIYLSNYSIIYRWCDSFDLDIRCSGVIHSKRFNVTGMTHTILIEGKKEWKQKLKRKWLDLKSVARKHCWYCGSCGWFDWNNEIFRTDITWCVLIYLIGSLSFLDEWWICRSRFQTVNNWYRLFGLV